jgi:KUP system potassium uptake protein
MSKNYLNRLSLGGVIITLGIIYGDIGTSPMYVMNAIIGNREITETLVLGAASLIFWTLTILTTVKYVVLTLTADNDGEGGVFSLFALVRKHSKKLVVITIIGAVALLDDGILTPPISISAAVEGLNQLQGIGQYFQPGMFTTVILIIAIISVVFYLQRFGTTVIGKMFGPIMAIWFVMILILGLRELIQYPWVLKAINPVYAFRLLFLHEHGWLILGGVFLCTTGAEALYSDLGHCGIKNIRTSWVFVKICLVVNYFGQAAFLLHNGSRFLDGHVPFFSMMPTWFLPLGIIIATAAAIIASQALISGSFTLINEAQNLNFWPRIAVRQPSDVKGQIYIPSLNTLLWIGCIGMVLYFKTSENMESVYGFSITVAMLMTTILLYYYLKFKLKWNWIKVTSVIAFFFILEASFFLINFTKLLERWQFLILTLLLFLVMYIWYYTKMKIIGLVKYLDLSKQLDKLVLLSNDDSIPKTATHLVHLTKTQSSDLIEEKIILSLFSKIPKRADVYWFLHVNRTNEPYTMNYETYTLVEQKAYKIVLNIGFRVHLRTELYFKKVFHDMLKNGELNANRMSDLSLKYHNEPEFKFIIIERFLSIENEFVVLDDIVFNTYFFLKQLGLSDIKAFGLEKSNVQVEYVPWLYQPAKEILITKANSSSF